MAEIISNEQLGRLRRIQEKTSPISSIYKSVIGNSTMQVIWALSALVYVWGNQAKKQKPH